MVPKRGLQLSKLEKIAFSAVAIFALHTLKKAFFEASTLYSTTYWWIDFSKISKDLLPKDDSSGVINVINQINEMLNDKRGWGSCGIDFQYTENKYKADILIYPVSKLKGNTIGITEWGLDYKSKCIIQLLDPETCESTEKFFGVLNHEFGHALMAQAGLLSFHSRDKNDLMYKSFTEKSELFPSAKYIRKIKHRVLPKENQAFSVLGTN